MDKDEEMRKVLQETWPDWEIVRELGRGSYGIVYRITRRDNIGTDAAAKVISIPQDASEVQELESEGQTADETRTYFKEVTDDCVRELKLMYSLKDQPNIVQVEDHKVVPKKDGVGWYILIREELLTSLKDYMSHHPITEEDVVKLGINICSALEACSRQNIIHRDIKPENLFISENGTFKLGDFGIARQLENMTVSMSMKGTSNYMAPEVMKSPNYDATVDIYSLGLVMYRLMNKNKMPFVDVDKRVVSASEREEATIRRMEGDPLPAPCQASDGLSAVILKACAYDPAQRFRTAAEMKKALANPQKFLETVRTSPAGQASAAYTAPPDETGTDTGAPAGREPAQGAKKRNILPVIIAAIVVVVLAAAAVVIFAVILPNQKDEPEPTPEPTVSETESPSESETPSGSETAEPDESGYSQEVQEALDRAEEYADNADYEKAMSTIREAREEYTGGDDQDSQEARDLQEKYQEYEDAYVEQALKKAEDQSAGGDPLAAYNTIAGALDVVGDNDEFSEKSKEYKDAYIQDAVQQADALVGENEYSEARAKINAALREFPDDETLLAELNQIPEDLLDFLYDGSNYWILDDVTMAGNEYGENLQVPSSLGGTETYYNLDGKFNTLVFTAGHIDGTTFDDSSLTFYLDGEKARTIELTSEMMPQEFTVDLNGTTQLKIEGNGGCQHYALTDLRIYP